ncbi:flap structure-specific endonuclease [Coprinopsis sp. MPI-PUGE-AT-0042]|nr:flap structure-specific endonuclease [Coprinopsis sp. MPI-PUGE-AT-0042]
MRDKEGRGLVNAHLVGFLRRIAKLLFYGIKPVFVFDGGAPVLKRSTLTERRKKKSGAAASHLKLAEKLLAAQMRREAVNRAAKGKEKDPNDIPPEEFVYLEDLEPGAPKTPPRPKPITPSSSAKKKGKFYDHDPYRLPEVDMDAVVRSKTSQTLTADPRLATEEELRSFIEDMRPEDFDVTSPAFRELPTEVQYEIIGDLRLKSRQTSYARLQKMLKTSKTPLDFSKQQIENLRQRNSLTQQLLVTTDTIGQAQISIPVRIASERNKEYVLIKNDDGSGGWILGVRDPTGSRDKPIEIDQDAVPKKEDQSGESEDDDMEEVEVPLVQTMDPDLRDWQRTNTLAALEQRKSKTDKGLAPMRTARKPAAKPQEKQQEVPLFDINDSDISDDDVFARPARQEANDSEDDEDVMAFAIQESLDQARKHASTSSQPAASSSSVTLDSVSKATPIRTQSSAVAATQEEDEEDDMYVDAPNRLQTALRFAHSHHSSSKDTPSLFGHPELLSMKSVPPSKPITPKATPTIPAPRAPSPVAEKGPPPASSKSASPSPFPESFTDSESDEEMEEVVVAQDPSPLPVPSPTPPPQGQLLQDTSMPFDLTLDDDLLNSDHLLGSAIKKGKGKEKQAIGAERSPSAHLPSPEPIDVDASDHEMQEVTLSKSSTPPPPPARVTPPPLNTSVKPLPERQSPAEPLFVPASRSPSPPLLTLDDHSGKEDDKEHEEEEEEEYDAKDLHAEEGEFVKFVSQVKGRDLDAVRREIDEEIATLNQQRKNAMRDSEDVNQQMVNQIMAMLRLFGIPYITAPMEAEAQCAELVTLGLVDGVITDDSDTFLFGAERVFKNMFNQSKTVECFLLSDLDRELGLDRDTLIQLAYLLGSDYTDGLAGVGPVVAMELVREFPGKDGLWKFKEWWTKVQSGKDTERESGSKFRRMFKKRFKDLYVAQEWPNTAVRDAYYHPTVDSSEEPFKWGLPDLDGLRGFFQEELGWSQSKVDDLLLPIIQKMNRRSHSTTANKQGNLNDFLGVMPGTGTHAPRQRQAYASKRLQQVVSDFRKKRARGVSIRSAEESQDGGAEEGESQVEQGTKKRRKTKAAGGVTAKGKKQAVPKSSNNTKSKGKAKAKKAKPSEGSAEDSEGDSDGAFSEGASGSVNIEVPLNVELRPRPKPRPLGRKPQTTDVQEAKEIESS